MNMSKSSRLLDQAIEGLVRESAEGIKLLHANAAAIEQFQRFALRIDPRLEFSYPVVCPISATAECRLWFQPTSFTRFIKAAEAAGMTVAPLGLDYSLITDDGSVYRVHFQRLADAPKAEQIAGDSDGNH